MTARDQQTRNQSRNQAYPTCVRHLKPRKDVKLRHFFLCDDCAQSWTEDAFDGNRPLWTSEVVDGYCQHCNRLRSVRLRTWFLCDICDRVARSIGRNHVAEQAILDFWSSTILPEYPNLIIEQNDPSTLRPRRSSDPTGKAPLDFLVRDKQTGKILFGIENKTGRSSIREMSAFQLDLSDCDSILNDVRSLGIPAYVIHVQVLEDWLPPTMGYRVTGMWWSDIYRLANNFRDVRMRRDERRGAAYFRKRAFSDISTFLPELFTPDAALAIVQAFKRAGVPTLYRLPD